MQQVPVHRDNKNLREALREKISSLDLFSSASLTKEVEDYFLPTIVYYYHLSKNNDFIKYLADLDFEDENFRYIFNLVSSHVDSNKEITGDNLLGDLHPGGSTKVLEGDKVVYKEYPDYYDLLSALAKCVYPDSEKFFPKIHKVNERFEREFVVVNKVAESKRDLKAFYVNLGRIIPFLLFLRAIDLNAENGLINLPYPVFFDMETIFSGDFAEGFDDYGVRNSGLVKVDEKNDSSFLTGGLKERESLLKPLICGTPKNPYIGWRTKSKRSYDNLPQIGDALVKPANYLNDMKDGYIDTVELILKRKNELQEVLQKNEAYIRVVIRPTRMYRFLILKSCYPQIYLENDRKEFMNKSLEGYNLIYRFKKEQLLEKEINALLDLKVPVFYSSLKEKRIFCPMGDRVGSWYKTPYQVWENYCIELNRTFFENQWDIIKESLN